MTALSAMSSLSIDRGLTHGQPHTAAGLHAAVSAAGSIVILQSLMSHCLLVSEVAVACSPTITLDTEKLRNLRETLVIIWRALMSRGCGQSSQCEAGTEWP